MPYLLPSVFSCTWISSAASVSLMLPERRKTPLLDSFATLNSRSRMKFAYDSFVHSASWSFATSVPSSHFQCSPPMASERSFAKSSFQPEVSGWSAATMSEALPSSETSAARRSDFRAGEFMVSQSDERNGDLNHEIRRLPIGRQRINRACEASEAWMESLGLLHLDVCSRAAALAPGSPAPPHEAQVAGRCHGPPSG